MQLFSKLSTNDTADLKMANDSNLSELVVLLRDIPLIFFIIIF